MESHHTITSSCCMSDSHTVAFFFVVRPAAVCLRRRPAANMEQPERDLTVHACLQRYAGANRLTIPVNYIIANAGTYMYLSDQGVSTQALSALNTTCPQAQHSAACNLTGADFTQPWDGGGALRSGWLAHVLHILNWHMQEWTFVSCCKFSAASVINKANDALSNASRVLHVL